jgi:hypothetical protein
MVFYSSTGTAINNGFDLICIKFERAVRGLNGSIQVSLATDN